MKLSFALCVALAACGSSGNPTGLKDITCPPGSTLTYANFGQAFMSDNCLECHNGKESPRLATQAQILSNKDKIFDQAVYTDAMPEDKDIPLDSRRMLGEWLACGAP